MLTERQMYELYDPCTTMFFYRYVSPLASLPFIASFAVATMSLAS